MIIKKHTKRSLFTSVTKGFTIIELLVSVGILAVISSVVLANHTRFNGSVLLESLAYDIGLSIREAQVFGVSVRQYNSQFQIGYGVRFADSQSYSLFADVNQNKRFDDEDEIIQNYALQNGFRIQKFCGVMADGQIDCSTDSSAPITHLAVVFLRPDPDAFMSSNELGVSYSQGRVTVVSPGGDTREVEIASTGQISIKNQ